MRKMLMAAALLALVSACDPQDPVTPPQPGDECQAAHDRLVALDCPEQTTPGGTLFVRACQDAAVDGRDWGADCIATIHSCSEVDAASRRELCR